MSDKIAYTVDTFLDDGSSRRILALMHDAQRAEMAAVEREILEGANRVQRGQWVCTAPTWRQHPLGRLRLAVARLRYRLAPGASHRAALKGIDRTLDVHGGAIVYDGAAEPALYEDRRGTP